MKVDPLGCQERNIHQNGVIAIVLDLDMGRIVPGLMSEDLRKVFSSVSKGLGKPLRFTEA